jgi:hypothetical protein
MENIFLLPTDKPSRLYSILGSYRLGLTSNDPFYTENLGGGTQNQNIYITSDEEIKDVRPHKGKWQLEKGEILNKFPNYLTDLSECKLVIMTTDQDLIKDGVQAIDDEFLEWFVKNPSCESVGVETTRERNGYYSKHKKRYKIIIPQEEPKKETLEEVAKIYSKNKLSKLGFIEGAKWQAERMYSEEEIRKSLLDIILINPAHISLLKSGYGEFPDTFELTEKGVDYIIEQFKKK